MRFKCYLLYWKFEIEIHFRIHALVALNLSNVLTDDFSNSLSEKTTNDIPMKFYSVISRRLFIGYRYQIVEFTSKSIMCDERLFSSFTARASPVLTLSHFKLDIYNTVNLRTRKAQNTVEFETMLCSTLLKIMADCSVLTENARSAHKSSSNDWNHFQMRITYGKAIFFRY